MGQGEGFSVQDHLLRCLILPFLQPFQLGPRFSEVVREEFRNLVHDRVPASAFGTYQHAFDNLLFLFEDVKVERVVFVDGTGEYFHQASFHETIPFNVRRGCANKANSLSESVCVELELVGVGEEFQLVRFNTLCSDYVVKSLLAYSDDGSTSDPFHIFPCFITWEGFSVKRHLDLR